MRRVGAVTKAVRRAQIRKKLRKMKLDPEDADIAHHNQPRRRGNRWDDEYSYSTVFRKGDTDPMPENIVDPSGVIRGAKIAGAGAAGYGAYKYKQKRDKQGKFTK
jgi:hypothetical protein